MNDLRSVDRTAAQVEPRGPRTGDIAGGPAANRAGRSRYRDPGQKPDQASEEADGDGGEPAGAEHAPLTFRVSRSLPSMPVSAAGHEGVPAAGSPPASPRSTRGGQDRAAGGTGRAAAPARRARTDQAPSTRPSKRRDALEEEEPEEDRFPWHFQFQNDEPEELQAKSRLLSRAFRSSVG
jgi:hypothetical protein